MVQSKVKSLKQDELIYDLIHYNFRKFQDSGDFKQTKPQLASFHNINFQYHLLITMT